MLSGLHDIIVVNGTISRSRWYGSVAELSGASAVEREPAHTDETVSTTVDDKQHC